MGSLQFDNIMKVFRSFLTFTGATTVSKELDIDLPRGYIMKIHDAKLEVIRWGEDVEGISADKVIRYLLALIKDPDDITSVSIPADTVDHDVLMDHEMEVILVAGTAGDVVAEFSNQKQEQNFSAEGLDVFSARNMRLNGDVQGTDAADGTEALGMVTINYTLERITDQLIIQLLDIL